MIVKYRLFGIELPKAVQIYIARRVLGVSVSKISARSMNGVWFELIESHIYINICSNSNYRFKCCLLPTIQKCNMYITVSWYSTRDVRDVRYAIQINAW